MFVRGRRMASFYVRTVDEESCGLRPIEKPYFDLTLRIRLADLQGGKSAIKEARDKNGRINFPKLLKLFASLHGTYSSPPEIRRREF